MVSVNGTQGAGPIWPGNNGGKQVHANNTGEVISTGFIPLQNNNSIGRADLDNLSPYASMGVNLTPVKTNDISAITQKEAEEMFPNFTGYYTLSNPQEANYDLADMNFKLQTRTDAGANRYVEEHTNRAMAERHLSEGGYAQFLEQLDVAFG